MLKAIIFDMDGLMIDSERATYQCYVDVLKKLNLTMSEEFYKALLGKTLQTVTQAFYQQYGSSFPLDQVLNDVHDLLDKRFETQGVPIKKGLIALLSFLKENHYLTIIATSSTRNRVDRILEIAHLTQYFNDSICGDEVTHGKPDPEVFLKACEKLGVDVNEALVLEDSEAGIQAAYNAHIPVICIPDMKNPDSQYQAMTTQILHSLDEVMTFLQK